ncbi:hypothetical protein AB0C13_33935 [Streptomyces sp. NPDC049099]|uniref:hypothetical protein n=1 Tax=Streptomyces sp. NPDC049099 TaxID=3155768 RepID=UPI0034483703
MSLALGAGARSGLLLGSRDRFGQGRGSIVEQPLLPVRADEGQPTQVGAGRLVGAVPGLGMGCGHRGSRRVHGDQVIQDAALGVLGEFVELAGLETEAHAVEEGQNVQELGGLAVGGRLGQGDSVQLSAALVRSSAAPSVCGPVKRAVRCLSTSSLGMVPRARAQICPPRCQDKGEGSSGR